MKLSGMERPCRSLTALLFAAAVCAALLLSGCVKGPKYVRPTAAVPATYAGLQGWKPAEPSDQTIRGNWWELFHDPQLNALEEKVDVSNDTLKAAEARFDQARESIRFYRASLYPTINGSASILSERQSSNRPLRGATSPTYYGDFVLPAAVSWEADIWGRVRHLVQSSQAQTQATAADVETVRLSLHAELATDYFQLRGLDAEKQVLDQTVSTFEQALELTRNRFRGGVSSEADVALAEAQLQTTRAQAVDVGVARSQFQHAIAALMGDPAGSLDLPMSPLVTPPPAIPVGLPSELLERRPDIASAERRIMSANEQIGVARAAFFPTITLNAGQGFEGNTITSWLLGPSTFWTVGPSAALTLFDTGRRRSISEQAMSFYNQSVDTYRESVIEAIREVEDNLSALRILEEEAATQQAAVVAAERALALANNRYKGGVASYLEVITAQSLALANERAAAVLLRRRMVASVGLIEALGGGWNVSNLPVVTK